MDKLKELERLGGEFGVSDFSEVTDAQFREMQKRFARGGISKEEMSLLLEAMPNSVQLMQSYADGLKATINSAKEVQKEALQGISRGLDGTRDVLKILANKVETDAARLEIAKCSLELARYEAEISKIIRKTNRDNMKFWSTVITSISGAAVAVVILFRRK